MTTELSFLLDLLLNQRMPLATKELVAARIKEVELSLNQRQPIPLQVAQRPAISAIATQAPSTQAILERNPDLIAAMPMPAIPPPPVVNVAQTPAAVAAMNARQQAINQSISGKPEKGMTSPRKF